MRIRRNKTFRRIMRWYRMAFGVQEPYHVVVDGTFLTNALQNKIHVKEQLPKVLNGRATPMVTDCVLAELRSLGERATGAAIIAKGYYRVKCGHRKTVSAFKCIKEQIGERNNRKFLVATQDQKLQHALKKVPGVPLLHLSGQVPMLEDPSKASRAAAKAGELKKMMPSGWEKPRLPKLKEAQQQKEEAAARPPKKWKGPKGPNPLSVLKPKLKQPEEEAPAPPAGQKAAKRARSRRMGTRTRAEAESLLKGKLGAAGDAVSAEAARDSAAAEAGLAGADGSAAEADGTDAEDLGEQVQGPATSLEECRAPEPGQVKRRKKRRRVA